MWEGTVGVTRVFVSLTDFFSGHPSSGADLGRRGVRRSGPTVNICC